MLGKRGGQYNGVSKKPCLTLDIVQECDRWELYMGYITICNKGYGHCLEGTAEPICNNHAVPFATSLYLKVHPLAASLDILTRLAWVTYACMQPGNSSTCCCECKASKLSPELCILQNQMIRQHVISFRLHA